MLKLRKYPPRGFTLIELLVVVLIIGILAAIALPNYQRAAVKAKSAQLKTLVSSIVKSVQNYYLVNDSYPTSFDEIDVDVEWEYSTDNVCDVARPGNKGIKQYNGMQVVLNYYTGSAFKNVLAIITEGPYKCTGFVYFMEGEGVPLRQLICTEATYLRGSKDQRGDFCEKVMEETYFSQKYSWWQFR